MLLLLLSSPEDLKAFTFICLLSATEAKATATGIRGIGVVT
jgi:hypothetical protein